MSPKATVLGSYRDADTGLQALKTIRRGGYHRSVALMHVQTGRTRVLDDDVLPGRAALAGAATALAIVAVYMALVLGSLPTNWTEAGFLGALVITGALLGFAAGRILDFGINNNLIMTYRRWVLSNETLVIVQTPMERAQDVMTLLRRVERGQPATFVIRSLRPVPARAGEQIRNERFTTERMKAHAASLATRQSIRPRPGRTYPLVERALSSKRIVESVTADLTDGASLGQSVSTAAEWLLDNGYIVQRHIQDVLDNLSRGFYHVLPILQDGEEGERPRVHSLAEEVVAHTDCEVHEQDIVAFLDSYQEVSPLTIAELWAMPLMLRLALVENLSYLAIQVGRRQFQHERADFWANRLLSAARRSPNSMLALIVELAREQSDAPPYLAERLVSQLQGEPTALEPVRTWLESKWGVPVNEMIQEEQTRHAATQVTIASTIGSLRRLSQVDWRETFERVSKVEQILRTDPSGTYPEMDFHTRNQYRTAVEEIARRAGGQEIDIASGAIQAAGAEGEGRRGHIGYFLADSGRPEFEARAGYRPPLSQRLRRWSQGHPALVYVGATGVITALVLAGATWAADGMGAGVAGMAVLLITLLLGLLPASEVAVQVVNYLATVLLRPRVLPKLSFETGIPEEWRTLVAVPVLLHSPEGIQADLDRLETRFLSNPDPSLHYSLLADFVDSSNSESPEDEELLQAAIAGVARLNERYGAGRFSTFYRTRIWSESEQRWMGWERKRGKLEELNRWLLHNDADPEHPGQDGPGTMRHVGDSKALRGVRFVITLDSDTQMPHGVAQRLVGTLAHPLNRPTLSGTATRVKEGYTVIQPRVSTSLPSAMATRFSRLFTDTAGTDPYTHAVSDVYQDLTGEGSYHGKGIYDVATFNQVLDSHFPDEALLSHDLIEGAHVRTGLASDIELLDEFPDSYVAYTNREHRWIRGDWQIADWVLPSVPARGGGRAPNPLDPMNRWKILDNLRRSLVPVASVSLLVLSWLVLPASAWAWSVLVALAVFMPAILGLAGRLVTGSIRSLASREGWREIGPNWARALLNIAFMPHQASLNVDAIARVFYRRWVSRRQLLEWQTAQMARDAAREQGQGLVLRVGLVSVFAALVTGVLIVQEGAFPVAALPFLVLWLFFPLIVQWLRGGKKPALAEALSVSDRFMLRRVARRTWRYFDEFVGRASNWLPPDNYQESLRVEVAERTSPTNIGLWLVSSVAAHDFGYITVDQLVQRNRSTMDTLRKLEGFEGHLLNWYNTRTLEPLYPRYVSTVDSGNLLASLWTLGRSYEDVLSRPILEETCLQGLGDALELALVHERTVSEMPSAADAGRVSVLIDTLSMLFSNPPDRLDTIVERIRAASGAADELATSFRASLPTLILDPASNGVTGMKERDRSEATEEAIYWIGQVERQLARWVEIVERYLPWVERLSALPSSYVAFLGAGPALWRDRALAHAPSLRDLASGTEHPVSQSFSRPPRPWKTHQRECASGWPSCARRSPTPSGWRERCWPAPRE